MQLHSVKQALWSKTDHSRYEILHIALGERVLNERP